MIERWYDRVKFIRVKLIASGKFTVKLFIIVVIGFFMAVLCINDYKAFKIRVSRTLAFYNMDGFSGNSDKTFNENFETNQ